MITLQFQPFDKAKLIEDLKTALPQYKVKKGIGAVQVRSRAITLTGVVGMNIQAAKGRIKTQTNADMAALFIVFFLPIGIYILLKRKKQQQMEQEVITVLKNC